MNLLELNNYKRRLKVQKCLCGAMAFFTIVSATREFNKNMQLNSSNVCYSTSEHKELRSELITRISENAQISIGQEELDIIAGAVAAEMEQICDPVMLTYEEKMAIIMERDGYTYDDLDAVCASCVAESYGDGNCYDECYDIASVYHNRTHSNSFVYDVNNAFGENAGYSYYNQLRAPKQFSVWKSGSYKDYLGRIDLLGYQAAIDMFYSKEPSNNYLNFNNVPPKNGSYEQLNPPYGNYFSNPQKEDDIIEDELVNKLVLELHN